MLSMRRLFLLLSLIGSNVLAASLEDLDFMTGRWQRTSADGVAEEWWMAPRGNTKVAAFRWAQDDRLITIELVIISQEADGIYLRFKHYGAQYDPWEKDEPNTYRLERAGSDEAVFVQISSNDKAPAVIVYRLTGDGLEFRGTDDANGEYHDSDFVIQFQAAET
jgi:hypothetical protein